MASCCRRYLGRAGKIFTFADGPRGKAKLNSVPTELLFHISTFPPESSILLLRRTCRRFYPYSSPNTKDLFDWFHSPNEFPERLPLSGFYRKCVGPLQTKEGTSALSLGLHGHSYTVYRTDHCASGFFLATSCEAGSMT